MRQRCCDRARSNRRIGLFAILGFEGKKLLLGRFFLVFIAMLLISNTFLCLKTVDGEGPAFSKSAEDLLSLYKAHPADTQKEFDRILSEISKKTFSILEERKSKGLSTDDVKRYESYTLDGVHSDEQLISAVIEASGREAELRKELSSVLKRTLQELKSEKEDGKGLDDYSYLYQAYAYTSYQTVLEELPSNNGIVCGWEEFFAYSYVDIFIFVSVLLLSVLLFYPEKQCGMLPVMRTCKNGRAITAAGKMLTLILTAILIVVLFVASTLLVVFLRCGLSDAAAPVQYLDSFRLFPHTATVFEFFLMFIASKAIGFLFFTAVSAFFSVLLYQPFLSLLGGAGVFAVSYLMNISESLRHPEWRVFNLLSITGMRGFSDRLHVLPLFFRPVEYITIALFACGICSAVFILLSAVMFTKGTRGIRLPFIKRLKRFFTESVPAIFTRIKKEKCRGISRAHGLLFWETKKALKYCFIWVILSALPVIAIIQSAGHAQKQNSYRYLTYLAAIEDIEGPLDAEKAERVNDAYTEARKTIDLEGEMRTRRATGEISEDEFNAYLLRLESAKANEYALSLVHEKVVYLTAKNRQTGVWGSLCDTESFEKLFSLGFDYPLYTAILVFCVALFVTEYGGRTRGNDFSFLQRVCRYGRKRTFRCKMLLSFIVPLVLSTIFLGIRLAFLLRYNDFSSIAADAALFSVPGFENYGGAMTVKQFAVLYILTRIVFSGLLGVVSASIASNLHHVLPALFASVSITLVPQLLRQFGLYSAGYFNFGGLFDGSGTVMISFETDLFGREFGFLILLSISFAATAMVLTVTARRRFLK